MSKYKVGDKFIINIKEVLESEKGTLYRANYNTLAFDDYGLDGLQKYDALQERLELREELKKAEYNKGLDDAWELLRKLLKMDVSDIYEVYGKHEYIGDIVDTFSPQEALAKLKAYEEAKIEVGDVVETTDLVDTFKSIVLDDDGLDCYIVMNENGSVKATRKTDCKKTGKHINLGSILEQIGE